MNTTQLQTLTPLRGIAALAILLLHCHQLVSPLTTTATGIIAKGYLSVDFFFMLSGFVLAHRYGDAFTGRVSKQPYGAYFASRCRRILPLYYLTLLLSLLIGGAVIYLADGLSPFWKNVFSVPGLLSSVVLLQGFPIHHMAVWNMPAWSLSVEWWAYLLFPFHPWLKGDLGPVSRHNIRLGVGVALYALLEYVIAPTLGYHHRQGLDLGPDLGVLRLVIGFSLGIATYRIYQFRGSKTYYNRPFQLIVLGVVLLVALHFSASDFLIVGIFPRLILATVCTTGRIKSILLHPVGQWLGVRSYSIYLVQMPVIYLLYAFFVSETSTLLAIDKDPAPGAPNLVYGWVLASSIIILTLLIANMTYERVEKVYRQARPTLGGVTSV